MINGMMNDLNSSTNHERHHALFILTNLFSRLQEVMDGILDGMDCPPAVRAQLEAAFRTMLSDPSAAAGGMQEILAMMGANAQQSPEEMLASVDVDTDSR
jgi:hypothetical protein